MIGSGRGTPIVVQIALLMAFALLAAFAVNVAVLIALPPRPPDVVRGDLVMTTFKAGFDAALSGKKLPNAEGSYWTLRRTKPAARRGGVQPVGMTRAFANKLNVPPERMVISFATPGRDVFMLRVRHSEFEVIEERHIHLRHHDELEWAPKAPRAPRASTGSALAPPPAPEPPLFAPPPPGVALMSGFLVSAQLPDGRWLTLRQRTSADEWSWLLRAGIGVGATLALLLGLSLLFARHLARPIQRFAHAAERVGVDPDSASVVEEGPRELRIAAAAFNAMQARLTALVGERTQMLAAVAHDMRTPLMRLRLLVDTADPALREHLLKQTGEIDALVSAFIAFARDDPTREERVRLDLAALAQSLVIDRSEAGDDVTYDGPERAVITGQALGLKRLLGNLIENAVKYGASAHVRLWETADVFHIDVQDQGPGVAPHLREAAFAPFERLGEQRTMGAGLGLAAARQIARAHGGDIVIEDGESGGALLRVTLPREAR